MIINLGKNFIKKLIFNKRSRLCIKCGAREKLRAWSINCTYNRPYLPKLNKFFTDNGLSKVVSFCPNCRNKGPIHDSEHYYNKRLMTSVNDRILLDIEENL
jgi:hypothetical protein